MTMELEVLRALGAATPGELKVNQAHFCWTLEDPIRQDPNPATPANEAKVFGDTAIPAGRYRVALTMSKRFGRLMLEVQAVPGYGGIRVHNGQTKANTEGCLLVNYHRDPTHPEWLLDFNRQAMLDLEARVQAALDRGEEVWITYHDPQPGRAQ